MLSTLSCSRRIEDERQCMAACVAQQLCVRLGQSCCLTVTVMVTVRLLKLYTHKSVPAWNTWRTGLGWTKNPFPWHAFVIYIFVICNNVLYTMTDGADMSLPSSPVQEQNVAKNVAMAETTQVWTKQARWVRKEWHRTKSGPGFGAVSISSTSRSKTVIKITLLI